MSRCRMAGETFGFRDILHPFNRFIEFISRWITLLADKTSSFELVNWFDDCV